MTLRRFMLGADVRLPENLFPADSGRPFAGPLLRLTGREARHARDVLRLKPGDEVILLDGVGREVLARILRLDPGDVTLEPVRVLAAGGEPARSITLGLGVLKSDRMDWVVQKATELGLTALAPLHTLRAAVRLEPKRAESRLERWREISRQAVKQCRRSRPVEILPVMDMAGFLALEADLKLMPYEAAGPSSIDLKTALTRNPPPKSILALIGPEGGFDPKEVDQAQAAGFQTVHLGPRILRAETAALALLSILGYELGEMSAKPAGEDES